MLKNISPWAAAAAALFTGKFEPVYYGDEGKVYLQADALWLIPVPFMAIRLAYAPGAGLEIVKTVKESKGVNFHLASPSGKLNVIIGKEGHLLTYQTLFTPSGDLFIPFWPRDIVVNSDGEIHVKQLGTRSGLIYVSLKKAGAFLYFQNLTSFADYNQQTGTSCADAVGGEWPEIGFALPPTKDKPLKKDKTYMISDTFIAFDDHAPKDEAALSAQYLDLLAAVYLQLPRQETKYQPWPETVAKGLHDLIHNPACWSQVGGHSYLNAYACDYATPPEIMVQLAVLLPLQDYIEWGAHKLEVMEKIIEGLPAFYNKELGTIMRWHPAVADKMEGEEEQKKPMVMDSWYLHHPLLNLSRLALKGNKVAEKLFLDSLEFAIKVAHHFKYRWPVFYKMDTLEVVKAETKPGEGGEKDVAGLYAHVMLQAWELTKKKRYLNEAERAAKTLQGLGFSLFYQANNTSFSAGAMLRLYKETKNKIYLELSYLCLANIFKNVHLWECNYGYGKHFPSFFSLFPLNDAPYTAVYEEQEVFCALHDYLLLADGMEILPSVSLLIAEYLRYLVDRAIYYYPPMLPKEILADKAKIGELNPDLWIALEDMQDGWEKCGQVGQEVYGAGNAFGIVPRHYFKIPGYDFMIYCDYPLAHFKIRKNKATFNILGDGRLCCKLMIIKHKEKLPMIHIEPLANGKVTKDGHQLWELAGSQPVRISWS
jgi:hypothetical protein